MDYRCPQKESCFFHYQNRKSRKHDLPFFIPWIELRSCCPTILYLDLNEKDKLKIIVDKTRATKLIQLYEDRRAIRVGASLTMLGSGLRPSMRSKSMVAPSSPMYSRGCANVVIGIGQKEANSRSS